MNPPKKLKAEPKMEPVCVVAPSHQTPPKTRDYKAQYQQKKSKKEAEQLLVNFQLKCLEECSQILVGKCSNLETEVIFPSSDRILNFSEDALESTDPFRKFLSSG